MDIFMVTDEDLQIKVMGSLATHYKNNFKCDGFLMTTWKISAEIDCVMLG